MFWMLGLLSFPLAGANFQEDFAQESKPIAKVVSLLESMSAKLEEDQKADEDMKEKLDCWCKKNSQEKLDAAEAAREKVEGLTTLVSELGPKIDELGTEIRSATQELNKNKATLETAATIRAEQVKNFKEDEASLTDSINGVEKAKIALNASSTAEMQSVYSASLVQQPEMRKVADNLQKVLQGRGAASYSKLSNGDKMILDDFIKRPVQFLKRTSFLQKSKDPSSSSIVGILQAMADDFSEDLQKEVDEEKANQNCGYDKQAILSRCSAFVHDLSIEIDYRIIECCVVVRRLEETGLELE